MATINLLEINVDALFQQYGINEINQVHTKLQQNIEEKKEELRMMVGERYRDLLQAADTIGEMRNTSSNVIEHIDGITTSCQNLNEHQLIGFKINTSDSKDILSKYDATQRNYYGCIAQINFLTKLPELIWHHLDNADYFIATQLFILARHISTGLQLDANMDIMRKFPVAKRHWNHLNQFYFMIKQMFMEQLEKPELTTETAVKCLTSLVLLENCQLDKLLTMFIQLRIRAFRRILTGSTDTIKTELLHHSAKNRILDGLQLINKTILQLFKCFIDVSSGDDMDDGRVESNKCLLVKKLELITGPNAKPIIALVPLEDSILIDALPSLISKFKPQINIQPIDSAAIQSALATWLQNTENDTKQLLKVVIDNISSVRTIHKINKAVMELENPSNWKEILHSLHLDTNIDFYQKFYEPLLQDRIKTIITGSWAKTMDEIEKRVSELFEGSLTDEKAFWVEKIEDNPKSLKQALDTNRQNHLLLMKTKGYTSNICLICEKLDKNIESIYNDLSLYVNSTNIDSIQLHDDPNVRRVNASLVEFLRNCSENGITDLISKVKSLAAQNNNRSEFILFLAKLLKAITVICPYIKQCLMPTTLLVNNSWTANESNVSNIEHWKRMCRLLNDESINLWKRWIELFISDCLNNNKGLCFSIEIDLLTLLDIFPNWEIYSIEEKDEQNASIQSMIRVPAHLSIPLQQFLFECCTKLNERIPETLPKHVTNLLADRLLECLVHTYDELAAKNEFVLSNQNAALQMYFDLKFLSLLFSSGKRNEQLQTIITKFKNVIDPFDFELFHKYISANVKFSVQRTLQQYGLLLPTSLTNQLATITKQSSTGLSQEKDPNLLCLVNGGSSHSNWFNLLPIVVTTKTVSAQPEQTDSIGATAAPKTEKRKSPAKSGKDPSQSTAQQNLANVKSNAAAFFGAMSQDWFR